MSPLNQHNKNNTKKNNSNHSNNIDNKNNGSNNIENGSNYKNGSDTNLQTYTSAPPANTTDGCQKQEDDSNSNEFVDIQLNEPSANDGSSSITGGITGEVNGGDGTSGEGDELTRKSCQRFDVLAKRMRTRIHKIFYNWGCLLQRHHVCVFVLAFFIFLPSAGVKWLQVETDMEKLLVESNGRLHDEVEFVKKQYGLKGFGEQEFTFETVIQTVKDDEDNILTEQSLKEHFDMVQKIKELQIETTINDKVTAWTLTDFCFKQDIPAGLNYDAATVMNHISPCYIMTPVDCFFEGAFIASNSLTYPLNFVQRSPRDMLLYMSHIFTDKKQLEKISNYMKKLNADTGYQPKECLDPTHGYCKRKNATKNLSIGELLTGGCKGVAENYMKWPEELIVSGVEKNESGYIVSAKALKTTIAILEPAAFAKYGARGKTRDLANFTHEHAKDILDAWKDEFIKLVNSYGKKRDVTTKMMGFSTISFQKLIDLQSMFQKESSMLGIILIIFYAIFTLKRWTNAIHSYGTMGFIGVFFVLLSVTNGLGLSYIFGMKLSALSIQVLPYLAVGLGLDNVFLLVRTYVFVCDSGRFHDKEIVGMCLGECGLSITITSFANACAFAMASIIPIVTLQDFARQASIIVAMNWVTIIFVFPSILSFDVERQKSKRYDLFCFKQSPDAETEKEQQHHQHRRSHVKNLNKNFSGNDLPYSINTQPTSNNINNKNNSTASPKPQQKFVLDRSRRQFNVKHPPILPQEDVQETSLCDSFIQKISLTYFAQNYYGRWLTCVQVKIIMLFLFFFQLVVAFYGCTKVTKGLNLVDIVPKNTPAHDFMSARNKYFSYYNFHMAMKFDENGRQFDYSTYKNQRILLDFHRRIRKVKHVLKSDEHNGPKLWLSVYSNWLQDAEKIFLREWRKRSISHECIERDDCETKETQAKLIYLLLGTTQKKEEFKKIKKFNASLVNSEGLVNPRWFYYGLTLWYWWDGIGTGYSEIGLRPEPERPRLGKYGSTTSLDDMFKAAPEIMLVPYIAHNLKKDADYIDLIKNIRSVCEEFFRKYDLPTFPKGIPFTYWEQFMFLEHYLLLAGGVVLVLTALIILITFMSLRGAFIAVGFLVATLFEMYGCLGLFHIELSAISAVTLIMSVGVAFEFTVHIVSAFINTPGDRNTRMRGALEITFAPMIDSAMTTIIMITVLATSHYDFVIKYFFHLTLCLMSIALINGVLVLPVVLSFFGPCCEITNRSVGPTSNPVYCIKLDISVNTFHVKKGGLSTITEVSNERSTPTIKTAVHDDDQLSTTTATNKSTRPITPFFPQTSILTNQNDYQINNYGNDTNNNSGNEVVDIDKATFKHKSDNAAWHHTPSLHKDEKGEYRSERGTQFCDGGPRNNKNRHYMRHLPPSNVTHSMNTPSRTSSNNNDNRNSIKKQTLQLPHNKNSIVTDMNSINNIDLNEINNHQQQAGNKNYLVENFNNRYNDTTHNLTINENNVYNNNSGIIIHDKQINMNTININNNRANHHSNKNSNINTPRMNNMHPRVIQVQPRGNNSSSNSSRCSTKLKATLSIELETSHPYGVTSSTCHDAHGGGEDGGMTRVDF